ncbi:unnamed protein product [Sphagnum balticum]
MVSEELVEEAYCVPKLIADWLHESGALIGRASYTPQVAVVESSVPLGYISTLEGVFMLQYAFVFWNPMRVQVAPLATKSPYWMGMVMERAPFPGIKWLVVILKSEDRGRNVEVGRAVDIVVIDEYSYGDGVDEGGRQGLNAGECDNDGGVWVYEIVVDEPDHWFVSGISAYIKKAFKPHSRQCCNSRPYLAADFISSI